MRAENLTKFFKFRTNVRSWKFDFKSQILGGLPQLLVVAPTQLPDAAPPRPTSAARGRGTRTFVRNVCSPTDRSVVRYL